jgi:hypothetical protein
VERLAGLKNMVATIGEVDVKRCEEGREGSDVMASCTPQCRNLAKHIVRGYRLPKERMQKNVNERGRACSGDKIRKENGAEYAVATNVGAECEGLRKRVKEKGDRVRV